MRRPAGHRLPAATAAYSLLIVLAACATSPGASTPSPPASPIGAAEALSLVLAEDPLFAGIEPRDPELIGQAAWTEVDETDDGWEVTIRIGWGDCPSGCIHEHQWTYAVSPGGEVALRSESGDSVPGDVRVQGIVVAGPTCPVVTDPPDPSCELRPVEGAELIVAAADGAEIGRTTSDADGRFALLLAPGAYRLEPQPVEGLMGTAEPIQFVVEWGLPTTELVVTYDTGIR